MSTIEDMDDERNDYYEGVIKKLVDGGHQNLINDGDENINGGDENINDDDSDSDTGLFDNSNNFINILLCYYKQVFEISDKITLFDGVSIEDKTSTNKCMEFIYGEIFRYENSKLEDKNVLYVVDDSDVTIDSYSELYSLVINGEPLYICPFVLPLISYLEKDGLWTKVNWTILNML